MITDNNPNLVSDEFSKFASEWKFDQISISPGHSRSNGKVESAMAIVKTLIKKVDSSQEVKVAVKSNMGLKFLFNLIF